MTPDVTVAKETRQSLKDILFTLFLMLQFRALFFILLQNFALCCYLLTKALPEIVA